MDWQHSTEDDSHLELSIVLPCFNEEGNVLPVYERVSAVCREVSWEMLFVDDGSADGTAAAVEALARRDSRVHLLRFIRNAGHQQALRAGYRAARGAHVLTLDADLQHPPEIIPSVLAKAREGYDVVQMVRAGEQTGFLKNFLSRSFYKFFNSISDVPIIEQASDFRLISRRVCDVLNALPERNLIVRAILPYLGFRAANLPYAPADRLHGQSSYGFRKSLQLGSQTLFNFSAFPLKLAMRLGVLISGLAFAYGIYNVAAKFFGHRNVPGYTDLIASTLFLGGLILVYLGILGRYVLVILDHLKRRPEYVLAESVPAAATGPEDKPRVKSPASTPPDASGRPQGRQAT